jgi:hypothetical protein
MQPVREQCAADSRVVNRAAGNAKTPLILTSFEALDSAAGVAFAFAFAVAAGVAVVEVATTD